MRRLLIAAYLLLFLSSPARAGWEEGLAAYDRGDYATAFREFLPIAEQGDPVAQYNLGVMYDQGLGVAQSDTEAVKWYRRAAEQGYALAQNNLGNMYFEGKGVPQSYAEAARWYRRAAEQGEALAQANLGDIYRKGQGVPQNYAEAVKWYRRAAEQGVPEAQNNLGVAYHQGEGVQQNNTEAVKWNRRAAEQGYALAQYNLGFAYSRGEGVPQDFVQAYLWYNLAASQLSPGQMHDGAIKWRHALTERMTPEQLALAQDMARNWRPKVEQPAPLNFSELTPIDPSPAPGRKSLSLDEANAVLRASEVQTALAALGYDPGPADGVLGSKTRAAIRAYQAAVGLPVDGEVSDALLASLRTALAHAGTAAPKPEAKGPVLYATGTGFVVSRAGYVLTNLHVVGDCALVRAGRSDAESEKAAIAAVDSENDLALLLPPAGTHAVATFRRGNGVRPGDSVVAVGFPLQGLLASSANVATGTVSALAGIRDDIRYLQISAPVQPGNSGGPLLDMSGNVVGVVVAKLDALKVAEATGDIPQNVNFAIKDSVARGFLDAKGVEYKTAPSDLQLTAAEVGERAAAFTVLVECWK